MHQIVGAGLKLAAESGYHAEIQELLREVGEHLRELSATEADHQRQAHLQSAIWTVSRVANEHECG